MLKDLFKKQETVVKKEKPLNLVKNTSAQYDELWIKCDSCGHHIYKKDLKENNMICKNCGFYFRMSAVDRIKYISDGESFAEIYGDMTSRNIINFPGYDEKLKSSIEKSNLKEAVVTGLCTIKGYPCVIAAMDSNFMMASMGTVVGEKITLALETATSKNLPFIIFTASGGARMQEGMISLMQMAKTSAAIMKHNKRRLLYITVLTDPTTGGVTASFAMLGDIIIAEKGATVGFAGRRVVEQTIRQSLPEDFQKADFILNHGFADIVAEREKMKDILGDILSIHRRVEDER